MTDEIDYWLGWHEYLKKTQYEFSRMSELEIYLEERLVMTSEGVDPVQFNALNWWCDNQINYRVLSHMVTEILAISISLVASESAFSAGGKVIDLCRASLAQKIVSMLMYGDWI